MNPFKPGDLVVCEDDANGRGTLEKDGAYEIGTVSGLYITVRGCDWYWHHERFRPLMQEPKENP
jgi:hypothetical protein